MDDQIVGGAGAGGGGAETPTPSSTPAGAGATGAPVPTADTYELTVNGKKIPISGRDKLIELGQKGYHYTQSMQELGEQRRAFQTEREEFDRAVAEARQFLQDEARIEAWLKELRRQRGGAAATGDAFEPDAFMTRAEAERLLQEERQRMMGMTQQEIARLRTQVEVEQLAAGYSQQLNAHLQGLVGQYPELKGFPRLEKALKSEVAEMNPRSLDEAKTFMAELAGQWAGQLREQLAAERKKAETPPALSRGIEPPGGAGPMPQAAPAFKRVSDPGFKEAVMRELMDSMKTGG